MKEISSTDDRGQCVGPLILCGEIVANALRLAKPADLAYGHDRVLARFGPGYKLDPGAEA
jgi:hypothetical protein